MDQIQPWTKHNHKPNTTMDQIQLWTNTTMNQIQPWTKYNHKPNITMNQIQPWTQCEHVLVDWMKNFTNIKHQQHFLPKVIQKFVCTDVGIFLQMMLFINSNCLIFQITTNIWMDMALCMFTSCFFFPAQFLWWHNHQPSQLSYPAQ